MGKRNEDVQMPLSICVFLAFAFLFSVGTIITVGLDMVCLIDMTDDRITRIGGWHILVSIFLFLVAVIVDLVQLTRPKP